MPSPTFAQLLAESARALAAVSDTPRLDVEYLLAHCLGISRSRLLAQLRDAAPQPIPGFDKALARRRAAEPVAYILGHQDFFGLNVTVRPPILVPRPETEDLVACALEVLESHLQARVLDLCTGSGCVAVSIARHAAQSIVLATDLNPEACALATENCHRVGVAVEILHGDLFDALPRSTEAFDVIVSNPPYVEDEAWATLVSDITEYEDPRALLAGADGLDVVRRIVADAPQWLKPGGMLALEIGETQYPATAGLLESAGFTQIHARKDLAGIDRIAVAHLKRPDSL